MKIDHIGYAVKNIDKAKNQMEALGFAFEETVTDWIQLLNIKPDAVVADLHPGYASTVWGRNVAERRGLPFYQVQHHHAHALSVMAEHHLTGKKRKRNEESCDCCS